MMVLPQNQRMQAIDYVATNLTLATQYADVVTHANR